MRDKMLSLADIRDDDYTAHMATRACALHDKMAFDHARIDRLLAKPIKTERHRGFYGRVRAQVFLRCGREADAVRQIEEMRKTFPDYHPALDHLIAGLAHLKMGHASEARAAVQLALRE